MSDQSRSTIHNQLLRSLSAEDLRWLHPRLEPVSLNVGDVLVEPNKLIEHVHFLEQGVASVVAISPRNQRLEISNVGREGMAGTVILLDVDRSPHLTFVQVAGSALRMTSSDLRDAMENSPMLQRMLLRYLHTVTVQIAHTALSLGRFTIHQRLARWLLMARDRTDSDKIPLTHEFLALMLGCRRPGVTEHLQILEGNGLIKAQRGVIEVLDRAGLEELAADCYGVPETEYAQLIHFRDKGDDEPASPVITH